MNCLDVENWMADKAFLTFDTVQDEAVHDHCCNCETCDAAARISCEDFASLVTLTRSNPSIWQGLQDLPQLEDMLSEHFDNCQKCSSHDWLSCQDFKHLVETPPEVAKAGILDWHLKPTHRKRCSDCRTFEYASYLLEVGERPSDFPCSCIGFRSLHLCDQHENAFECPDTLVIRNDDGTFGLPIRDGGCSQIQIDYCPWCGTNLNGG